MWGLTSVSFGSGPSPAASEGTSGAPVSTQLGLACGEWFQFGVWGFSGGSEGLVVVIVETAVVDLAEKKTFSPIGSQSGFSAEATRRTVRRIDFRVFFPNFSELIMILQLVLFFHFSNSTYAMKVPEGVGPPGEIVGKSAGRLRLPAAAFGSRRPPTATPHIFHSYRLSPPRGVSGRRRCRVVVSVRG